MAKVKVKYTGQHGLPEYQTKGAAAIDLHAEIGQPRRVEVQRDNELIPTGLYVEVPKGYCLKIYPRSGISHKEKVRLSNCVGIIDSDYRGQVMVSLQNDGSLPYIVMPGDRIAQAVLEKVERITWEVVEDVEETDRGEGGFGSTGKAA